ncbi:MAG: hypothetical protein ABI983_00290 [Acidobacteriota bacterium]
MSTEEMRPSKMWRQMPADLRTAAARAFWADEQAALEQAEAVALIARQIKFRPKSVITLTHDKKARHLSGITQVSDLLAARLVIAYHLEHQRPMMGAFLDLLGIAHEDGLIKAEEPQKPDDATLDKAVKELAAKFPKAEVARYFWALLWQDPETWTGLKGRPELELE